MNAAPPGVVFDCVVFVQALANPKGPAFACIQLVDAGRANLFVSPQSLAELTEVLNRPKLRRKLKALTGEGVEAFLQALVGRAVALTDVPQLFSYERDPKDEPYVNLALAAGAHFLVTWDSDLLDLMVDDTFHQRFPSLTILNPVAFLQQMSNAQP